MLGVLEKTVIQIKTKRIVSAILASMNYNHFYYLLIYVMFCILLQDASLGFTFKCTNTDGGYECGVDAALFADGSGRACVSKLMETYN